MPKILNGFKALTVQFSSSSSAHQLFIKEHFVRATDADKPQGRTLFVINLPPYTTKECLKRAFSTAGPVVSVILQNKIENGLEGFKVAYIVYNNPSSLLKALQLKMLGPLNTEKYFLRTGLENWLTEYNRSICDNSELQKQVNVFMEKYDKEQKLQTKEKEVDDEGWTVVTKKGRNPGISRTENVENKITEKMKKKMKHRELKNFYTFQIRESKKKHIEELRKKFQADKNKINLLKQNRKFKPF